MGRWGGPVRGGECQAVGEDLRGDRGKVRRDVVRRVRDPDVYPLVELEAGVLAEVLDRPLQLPGISFRDEIRGELGVEDDDEALVAGDDRAGPRRRVDLDLVRCEGEAGERDGAVRVELNGSLARGGHHGRYLGAQALPDLRQERLHPAVHEVRLVADQLDLPDVDLVADEAQQRVPLA